MHVHVCVWVWVLLSWESIPSSAPVEGPRLFVHSGSLFFVCWFVCLLSQLSHGEGINILVDERAVNGLQSAAEPLFGPAFRRPCAPLRVDAVTLNGFPVAVSHCAPDFLKDYKQVMEEEVRPITILITGGIGSFKRESFKSAKSHVSRNLALTLKY